MAAGTSLADDTPQTIPASGLGDQILCQQALSVAEFGHPWPGWIDGTVRPYVAAYAYLLGGFTSFDQLGGFNRLALSWRVFGKDVVDQAQEQITGLLEQWGYRLGRDSDHRMATVICQSLLLNRSPLLEDLTTEAFDRLRQSTGMRRWHLGALFGFQRAVAALGYCEPPSFSAHGTMPAIEGAPAAWTEWIERWHDTSTLTPESSRHRPGSDGQGRPLVS
ncbi:hypothetical protein ACGFNP_46825 [Nonomuraea sp. NPDC049269]|uniref:hypothetical protein n=1 Tax=Nonomuraea sp. NPDC049269 TaxID=3364349 RepID=UPI00371FFF2B